MKKILIVEDAPELRNLFCRILEAEGYRVETAEDGLAGLEALNWFAPELVLLNVMMPRMDGLSMLQELARRRGRSLPKVVMMSANMRPGAFELAMQFGAMDYLYYPMGVVQLREAVREALELEESGERRVGRARLKRVVRLAGVLGCDELLTELRGAPLGGLDLDQRHELKESLRGAALREIEKAGPRRRGIAAALKVLGLAEAV